MTIARLNKITIAGTSDCCGQVVSALQSFGQLHIIDAQREPPPGQEEIVTRDKQAESAMLFLQGSKYKRRPLTSPKNFDFQAVVAEALAIKQELRSVEDRLGEVLERIVRVTPWGDFSFPPDQYVEHFRFWFYLLPVAKRNALDKIDLPWQIVGRSSTRLYVVVICQNEPVADLLPVAREHLGSKPLQQLQQEHEQFESRRDELLAEREALTRYLYLMRVHMVKANNRAHYHYVLQQTQQHSGFFTLQAWLPEAQLDELRRCSEEHRFAFIAERPTHQDNPPTLLQPQRGFASGASLAAIYQTPGYHGWDPSAHLYFSFSLFFAMILSDAGYGLLLALALLIFWQRLGASPLGTRLRTLFRFMVGAAVAWGVIVGSYFGYGPPANTILASLNWVNLTDHNLMMRLSIGVGILHIIIANITYVWVHRRRLQGGVAKLGWLLLAVSGYGWWLMSDTQFVSALLQQATVAGLATGAAIVLLGSGARAYSSVKATLLNLASGLMALTNLTKLFGDALSYMRLFALGLASASLAITFNQLAAPEFSAGGFGFITGGIIFLLGHIVNLALGIMGGVVHGLRLNFIEFYNWGEPGEGYVFTPFEIKEVGYE
ncbi:hypothetical protein [Halioxenophilus sp. WMMB6]|uniref:V-type ATP synthase subunit I n=1 Tax=Halioxenophilus sp. WMMB6 TaxID=3073815 RepID=UPI00295F2900|nr:hypothetical protein [Halioxenophilus sp. WMMB6]